MAKNCFICNMSDVNDLELGEFLQCNDIHVHYFCLLLTTGLQQNGEDDEGLLGFLIDDIRKCARRLKKNICYICHKPHANIVCSKSDCSRKFHTPCGLNRCLNKFNSTFMSFCERDHQIPKHQTHKKTESCIICYEPMMEYNPITSIKPICCKSGWMHKKCVAHYAKNAGYFCKCPLCKSDEQFRNFIVSRGIFIPDKDAAWELEPNAYSELLARPEICQAMNCFASRRDLRNLRNRMKTCTSCGAYIAHIKCWNGGKCGKYSYSNFICHNCTIFNSDEDITQPAENGSPDDKAIIVSGDGETERDCPGQCLGRTRYQTDLKNEDVNESMIEVKSLRGRKIKLTQRQSDIRQSLDSTGNFSSTSEQSFVQNTSKNDDSAPQYETIASRQNIILESDLDGSCESVVKELRGRKIQINTSKDFNEHSGTRRSINCNVSSKNSHNIDNSKNSRISKRRRRITIPAEDGATTDYTDDTEWEVTPRLKRYRQTTSHGILTDISNEYNTSTPNSSAVIAHQTTGNCLADRRRLNAIHKRQIAERRLAFKRMKDT